MTPSDPFVTIGLPVRNNFLSATLDSLLAQDYPELELIISE
jgi:glycosyltransferase involved in cell wall biosynthesis